MKITNFDHSTLMEVTALDIKGSNLVIKGTILGTMPIAGMLTAAEARRLFRLVSPRLFLFLLTLPFRR